MKQHIYPWTIVSVSFHYMNPTQRVSLEQSGRQDSVSEWGDMSIPELLLKWARIMKIQLSVYKADLIISLKNNLFLPWYGWKIVVLALSKNSQSLTY